MQQVQLNEVGQDAQRDAWLKECRVKCRLAWNNWPDNETSRREIEAHEKRDPISAAAWDRVVAALRAEMD